MNLAFFMKAAEVQKKDLLVLKGNGERVAVDVLHKALQERQTDRQVGERQLS